MQRQRAWRQHSGFAHRQPGGGQPGLPVDVDQPGRHGTVARNAQPQGDEALLAVALGQVAQAVGGVGQTVQEHRHPFHLAARAQQIGAVPVGCKMSRIDGGILIVAIAVELLLRRRSGDHLPGHQLEQLLFVGQIGLPVAVIELLGTELGRHQGVPGLQRFGLPGEVGYQGPAEQQQAQQAEKKAANEAAGASQHGRVLGTDKREAAPRPRQPY